MDLAQDKRTIDQDGRLHVPGCRISKANVCPYFGREIPDWQALGLDPNRIYRMYRTPELLQAAAASYNNVPLTTDHILVTADDFPADRIAGTVSNPRYEHPYLLGDVTAWTADAIAGIQSNEQKELSCAYRYVAHMMPGNTPDGVGYDGQMIPPGTANHVALVEQGRAGPDVVVADGAPRMPNKSRFPRFFAALGVALAAVVPAAQLAALDSAMAEDMKPGCVGDEFPDLSAEDKAAACDNARKELGKDSLNETEEREAYQRAAKDRKMKTTAVDSLIITMDTAGVREFVDAEVIKARDGFIAQADADKLVMDSATAARAEVHALYAARSDVEERVGVVAVDTAEGVYRFAFDKLNIPHKDVPASALAALYQGIKAAPLAQDSRSTAGAFNAADIYTPVAK